MLYISKVETKAPQNLDGIRRKIERVYDISYSFWTKRRPHYTLTWWNDPFLKRILNFREILRVGLDSLGTTRDKSKTYVCKHLVIGISEFTKRESHQ